MIQNHFLETRVLGTDTPLSFLRWPPTSASVEGGDTVHLRWKFLRGVSDYTELHLRVPKGRLVALESLHPSVHTRHLERIIAPDSPKQTDLESWLYFLGSLYWDHTEDLVYTLARDPQSLDSIYELIAPVVLP